MRVDGLLTSSWVALDGGPILEGQKHFNKAVKKLRMRLQYFSGHEIIA